MRKILLPFIILTFVAFTNSYAQSDLIIDENFQWWDPTEGVDMDPDSCGTYPPSEYLVERDMDILTSSGFDEITVKMVKVVIKPECPSRRVYDGGGTLPAGVSAGWVQLQKITDEYNKISNFEFTEDTIGEFVFGPIPQVDSIYVSHSATGSNRGFRIYTSTDGETWERPTDLEFWDGSDCQAGDSNVVEIFEEDVYIKLTAGFARSDSASQYTRLHDIRVWGVPGELQLGANNRKVLPNQHIIALGDNRFRVPDEFEHIQVYNIMGRKLEIRAVENELDLNSLNSGVYIIRAQNLNGEVIAEKVLRN